MNETGRGTTGAARLAVRRDDLFAAAPDQQHTLKIHRQRFDEHHIRSFPKKTNQSDFISKKLTSQCCCSAARAD